MTSLGMARHCALVMMGLLGATATPALAAGGEAGAISLRDQGFLWVGVRAKQVDTSRPGTPPRMGTAIDGQMHVGFQLVARKRHPYPLVLVHGGGGQATDWMGTPDGRDGWLDYFLAAGFDVYFVDRPAHGRSPNSRSYGEQLGAQPTTEFIANTFTVQSRQYPGGGAATSREVADHTASSEPGPTVSNAVLKEDLAELLDRIGPAILVTHSAGGPSGWLAMEARPNLVKGVLAIEPAMGITDNLSSLITFKPALAAGERIETEELPSEGAGLTPCRLQPKEKLRTVPAFAGKPVLFVVSPMSAPMFTPSVHCSVHTLNQLGASARLARLKEDYGIQGNGHFMNEELNNGEIAKKVFIPWLGSIK
ncbi:MAG: alpha/beta fold hydrolase [Steroidobacteraceae bacterium]